MSLNEQCVIWHFCLLAPKSRHLKWMTNEVFAQIVCGLTCAHLAKWNAKCWNRVYVYEHGCASVCIFACSSCYFPFSFDLIYTSILLLYAQNRSFCHSLTNSLYLILIFGLILQPYALHVWWWFSVDFLCKRRLYPQALQITDRQFHFSLSPRFSPTFSHLGSFDSSSPAILEPELLLYAMLV